MANNKNSKSSEVGAPSNGMKTIFITIFQGVEAKNILRTDIYKTLIANPDVRIVFFVDSQEREVYYKKEFSHPRVIYEVAPEKKTKGLDKIFSDLQFLLLRTATTDLRRTMAFETHKNYFKYHTGRLFNRLFARKVARKIVRALDYLLVQDRTFASYFEKYKPEKVFLAHLFDDNQAHLLREAKRRGVTSIGFVNSWDKLTARHSLRLLPDKLIVFNDIVKKEAINCADMNEKDIVVAGIPHYDWHVNYQPLSRGEFCKKKGIDPEKKLIVYAPMGKAFSNSDWDIIDLLRKEIEEGVIKNAELFVRFQPNDFVEEGELQKRRHFLKYDMPGVRFSEIRNVNWDMGFDDIKGLTDTLANANLFICYASSMSIDAAVFDVPVININFEVREKELVSKSPTHFYKMAHYNNAIQSGGIRLPRNKEDFIGWINKYLENPSLDKEGRKRLVKEQCWRVDGRAGNRIAKSILTLT